MNLPLQRALVSSARVGVLWAAALAALLGVGCASDSQDAYFRSTESEANVYVAPVVTPITKVAIMPFRAPTELIGASVADLFVTEMLRAGRYELVERSQMAKVLSEAELSLAGLSASKAAEIGAMLGADGVIIGTVDEYGTVAHRGKTLPVVGITTRLIDCQTGKVMWSVDLARRAEEASETLPGLARDVVHEMTAGLYQRWKVQRTVQSGTAAQKAEKPVAKVAPVAPPAIPSAFTLSDLGLREVVVSWPGAPTGAERLHIERATAPGGPFAEVAVLDADRKVYRDGEKTPLQDATTYYYRLVAEGRDGQRSAPSPVKESMTAPPPDAPSEVRAVANGSRAVRVAWTAPRSEGLEQYVVERALASGTGDWTRVGTVQGLAFEEGGTAKSTLRDETTYRYRVTAVNRVGAVGPPSEPVEVTTEPPPATVAGLAAESGQVRCVPLLWTANSEPDIVRYEVWRAGSAQGPFQKIAELKGRTSCRFLDGERDPGSLKDQLTYYYQVVAVDAVGGRSAPGEPLAATTRPPPPVVTGLQAEGARPREIPLAWASSADEKVVGYVVARADPDDQDFRELTELVGRETTRWTDRNGVREGRGLGELADGTTYRYRILAFNTARARSGWSEIAEATTKMVPVMPAQVTASTGQPRQVSLAWAANPEPDIASYVIESSDSPSGRYREVATVEGATLAYVHGDLADGEELCYRVRAVDRDTLVSPYSASACGATKPQPPPPSGLTVAWEAEGARVQWQPAAVPDVAAYRVLKPGLLGLGGSELKKVTGPEVLFSTAEVGKGLKVMVITVDADGLESERTPTLEIRPPGP